VLSDGWAIRPPAKCRASWYAFCRAEVVEDCEDMDDCGVVKEDALVGGYELVVEVEPCSACTYASGLPGRVSSGLV